MRIVYIKTFYQKINFEICYKLTKKYQKVGEMFLIPTRNFSCFFSTPYKKKPFWMGRCLLQYIDPPNSGSLQECWAPETGYLPP